MVTHGVTHFSPGRGYAIDSLLLFWSRTSRTWTRHLLVFTVQCSHELLNRTSSINYDRCCVRYCLVPLQLVYLITLYVVLILAFLLFDYIFMISRLDIKYSWLNVLIKCRHLIAVSNKSWGLGHVAHAIIIIYIYIYMEDFHRDDEII